MKNDEQPTSVNCLHNASNTCCKQRCGHDCELRVSGDIKCFCNNQHIDKIDEDNRGVLKRQDCQTKWWRNLIIAE